MKKIMSSSVVLTFSVFIAVFLFLVSFSVYADPPTGKTVSGKIQTSGHSNANGASVNVTCGSTTLPDTTDSNGDFSVEFTGAQCPDNTTINVTASFNGESGSDSRTSGNGPNVSFNVITLAPVAVPEFGAVTGMIAVIGSAAAFFIFKKRFV